MMESILQQAKADWLDRQRRQLFCLCYLDAYNTSKPSGFGWSHDKRLVIWGAVRDFIAYAGGENYLSPAFVPRYLYSGVLEWFVMHGTFPENLTATRLQHRVQRNLPGNWQKNVHQLAQEELLILYSFVAENEERFYTEQEQDEAAEKLRELLTLYEGGAAQ